MLMWGDGFYILYCNRNQNLCGKKGKKRGRRKRRKGEEKGERKEREKEAGRERRKRGEGEGTRRGGRVEPYLFSSIVSITAIPFTMTLSEGVSEQNMLSNSRCIISSLRGREGGEKGEKIGRERRGKEEKGEEMGT